MSDKFRYDLENAPKGTNLLLLTKHGGRLIGLCASNAQETGIIGWCHMPQRDLEEEARRGYLSNQPR